MMPSNKPTHIRLEIVQKALAESEGKIAELAKQRALELAETDGIEAVKQLDLQIAAHSQDAAIYRERAAALTERHKRSEAVRIAGDRPAEGERCLQTGRLYERGSGSLSRAQQTANYVLEKAQQAQRDLGAG